LSTPPVKSLLFIRPDAMGDLVLFTPVLNAFQQLWPETKISVIIQKKHLSLKDLFSPKINWIAITFDPWKSNPFDVKPEVSEITDIVKTLAPDLVVAACSKRSWLDSIISSVATNARHVAFKTAEHDPYWTEQFMWAFGKEACVTYKEIAPEETSEQDWQKSYGIVRYLTKKSTATTAPEFDLPEALNTQAKSLLKKLGLEGSQFAVCASAGSANVAIKNWPTENYAYTISHLETNRKIRTLVIGHTSESEAMASLKAKLSSKETVFWLGSDEDLPLLTALINQSLFYFGNDTGPMHLAAACKKPVLGIFGGGTWPRFKPAAKRSIALHIPLPCYSCNWDCPFKDAPCIKAVSKESVIESIDILLETKDSNLNEVRALPDSLISLPHVLTNASELYKISTGEHLKREVTLIKTAALAAEKDKAIQMHHKANKELTEALVGQDKTLKEKDLEIELIKRAADAMDLEIKSQTQHSESKDKLIKSLHSDNQLKQNEITHLLDEIEQKDASILSLHEANAERVEDLKTQATALLQKEAMIANLAKECEERLAIIKLMEAEIARLSSSQS
jgi:hypothetical protein